ncbi:MAG TPA: ribonuclease H-like domain-containing protein [Verrucomicrobiae bacterium]|nr:ribonuclease H-like domain-containing protein [Verrucomicrobiae bacterium]
MSDALRQRLQALSQGATVALNRRPVTGRSHPDQPGPDGTRMLEGGTALASPTEDDLAGVGFRLEDGIWVRRVAAAGPGEAVAPQVLALLAGDLAWAAADPGSVWYFDTETTGLAGGTGTVPFLYGWGRQVAGALELEQWLLVDLGSEARLVERVLRRLAGATGVVTFNGATFDLPLVRARAILNRREALWRAPVHLDLLPLVRRFFGHRLSRCSLSEVERRVLETWRSDDLPGAEVPERYRSFLRDGGVGHLIPVLRHNQIDVGSLADLLVVLGRLASGSVQEPADHLGLARFYEARGASASAHRTYATALRVVPPPLDRAAARHHARLLRREGRPAEASSLWRLLWERWRDLEAAEALCVDLERRVGDLEAALRLSEAAIEVAPPAVAERFAHRIWRLERRRARRAAAVPHRTSGGASPGADQPPPWSGWLPGGSSYEAWQTARRRRLRIPSRAEVPGSGGPGARPPRVALPA